MGSCFGADETRKRPAYGAVLSECRESMIIYKGYSLKEKHRESPVTVAVTGLSLAEKEKFEPHQPYRRPPHTWNDALLSCSLVPTGTQRDVKALRLKLPPLDKENTFAALRVHLVISFTFAVSAKSNVLIRLVNMLLLNSEIPYPPRYAFLTSGFVIISSLGPEAAILPFSST